VVSGCVSAYQPSAICCWRDSRNGFGGYFSLHATNFPKLTRLLADFKLADVDGEPLPEKYLQAKHFAPEVNIRDAPCTPGSDVWQVGKLVAF
jgi:hypothetical protein